MGSRGQLGILVARGEANPLTEEWSHVRCKGLVDVWVVWTWCRGVDRIRVGFSADLGCARQPAQHDWKHPTGAAAMLGPGLTCLFRWSSRRHSAGGQPG